MLDNYKEDDIVLASDGYHYKLNIKRLWGWSVTRLSDSAKIFIEDYHLLGSKLINSKKLAFDEELKKVLDEK